MTLFAEEDFGLLELVDLHSPDVQCIWTEWSQCSAVKQPPIKQPIILTAVNFYLMFCGAVAPGQIPVYVVRLADKDILILIHL